MEQSVRRLSESGPGKLRTRQGYRRYERDAPSPVLEQPQPIVTSGMYHASTPLPTGTPSSFSRWCLVSRFPPFLLWLPLRSSSVPTRAPRPPVMGPPPRTTIPKWSLRPIRMVRRAARAPRQAIQSSFRVAASATAEAATQAKACGACKMERRTISYLPATKRGLYVSKRSRAISAPLFYALL